jgi:hypothetical protein
MSHDTHSCLTTVHSIRMVSREIMVQISFNFRYITRISSPRCKGFLMRKLCVSLDRNNHEALLPPPPFFPPQIRSTPSENVNL